MVVQAFDSLGSSSSKHKHMIYRVKQVRTYTTRLWIEAENIDEAEAKYLEMLNDGSVYSLELEQMDVSDEDYKITESLRNFIKP